MVSGLTLWAASGCALGQPAGAADMATVCGSGYAEHTAVSRSWTDGMAVYLSGDQSNNLDQKNKGQEQMDEAKATWTGLLRGFAAKDVTPQLRTALTEGAQTVAGLGPPFTDDGTRVPKISADYAAACAANNTPVTGPVPATPAGD